MEAGFDYYEGGKIMDFIIEEDKNINKIYVRRVCSLIESGIFVNKPNLFEKFLGITWEDKINKTKRQIEERYNIIENSKEIVINS